MLIRSATLLLLTLLGGSSFAYKAPPKPVMVFAVAYDENCGGGGLGVRTEMADTSTYNQARKTLEESMKKEYPQAKGVRAGSSFFEFGDSAGAVTIISVESGTPTCPSSAIVVQFGVDVADASARAAKVAGKRPYRTLKQEYFVKERSAP